MPLTIIILLQKSIPKKLSLATQRDAKRRVHYRGVNEIGNTEDMIIIPFVSKYPLNVCIEWLTKSLDWIGS